MIIEPSGGSEGGSFFFLPASPWLMSLIVHQIALHYHTSNYSAGVGVSPTKQCSDQQKAQKELRGRETARRRRPIGLSGLDRSEPTQRQLPSGQTQRSLCLQLKPAKCQEGLTETCKTQTGASSPPNVNIGTSERRSDLRCRGAWSHLHPLSPPGRDGLPGITHRHHILARTHLSAT